MPLPLSLHRIITFSTRPDDEAVRAAGVTTLQEIHMAFAIQGARLDGGQLCSPNMTSSASPRVRQPLSRLRARRGPGRAVAGALAGCGGASGAPPAEGPAPGPRPRPRRRSLSISRRRSPARPAKLPARELRAADWSARVFGAGEAKIEPKEKLVAISIPLGTDTHVECFVYNTMLDSGEVIRNFYRAARPCEGGGRSRRPWEVSVHRESPAVFVQALYLVPTGRREGGRPAQDRAARGQGAPHRLPA